MGLIPAGRIEQKVIRFEGSADGGSRERRGIEHGNFEACEAHRTDARQKAQMSLFEVGGQANPLTPNFIFLLLVET